MHTNICLDLRDLQRSCPGGACEVYSAAQSYSVDIFAECQTTNCPHENLLQNFEQIVLSNKHVEPYMCTLAQILYTYRITAYKITFASYIARVISEEF